MITEGYLDLNVMARCSGLDAKSSSSAQNSVSSAALGPADLGELCTFSGECDDDEAAPLIKPT